MGELRIAVVDDHRWTREHMAQELDLHDAVAVVHALDQDEALRWPIERWVDIDVVVVDVIDEFAPGEIGTDLYAGIGVLDRLRELPVRTVAITRHRSHPLVEQRIYQSGAHHLYRSWEVNDLDRLVHVIVEGDDDHVPLPIATDELARFGARTAQTNRQVAELERSPLHERIAPEMDAAKTDLPRRTLDAFRHRIMVLGFAGTEYRNRAGVQRTVPRWPDTRDYLLRLIGRKDAPSTDTDGNDLPGLDQSDPSQR